MQKNKAKPNFTHISFSGGGFCGLIYLGVIRYLKQESINKNIMHIVGTSVGSLFALLLALDIPLDIMEKYTKDLYVNNNIYIDIQYAFSNILKDKGFINSNIYTRNFETLYENLDKMTFMDLAKKTGKNLIITATYLETMEPVFFSVDNTPNVLITDAIEASTAIPLINPPKKIGNDYYIDGGVTCNSIPLIFDNVPSENILLLHLSGKIEIDKELLHNNLIYYIITVLTVYNKNNTLIKTLREHYPYYIKYDNFSLSIYPMHIIYNQLSFDISNEDIDKAIEYGYEDTHSYFEQLV